MHVVSDKPTQLPTLLWEGLECPSVYTLAPLAMNQVLDLYSAHMCLMEQFGIFVKKHHWLWHLLRHNPLHGNPTLYAT